MEDHELQAEISSAKAESAEASAELARLQKRLHEAEEDQAQLLRLEREYRPAIAHLKAQVNSLAHGNTKCLKSAIRKVDDELGGRGERVFWLAIEQDNRDLVNLIEELRSEVEICSARIGNLEHSVSIMTTLLMAAR